MEHTQLEPAQNERERELTWGQVLILGAAAVPMLAVGGLGGWGTFTNISRRFPEDATALGVVAAGEGATLVLALVMVGLTLLGQSSPGVVRLGLWVLPAVASATGAIVASGMKEAVVNAVTPLAMSASAEGIGLLARRIVVYRTGVDIEARRRNAATVQRMAVLRALAANHPRKYSRKRAELASWRLARKVGVGDDELGTGLVTVQRARMTSGADTALAAMFTPPPTVTPALPAPVTPSPAAVTSFSGSVTPAFGTAADRAGSVTGTLNAGPGRAGTVTGTVTGTTVRHTGVTAPPVPVPTGVTQVSADSDGIASRPGGIVALPARDAVSDTGTRSGTQSVTDTGTVTAPGTPAVTETVTGPVAVTRPVTETCAGTDWTVTPSRTAVTAVTAVTLQEIATVAGVPVPERGERLTGTQLVVVLRHLRYREDPPLSYRQAVAAFREAGFVGGEERIRRTWAELTAQEGGSSGETGGPSGDTGSGDGTDTDRQDEEEAAPRP
ncbi:hypothetical protein CRV15_29335 (plasmid) [Streptomyces clavuligerus]|uniref:Spd1-like putative membrane protein n=1 Tax=Streptomyces clavuligerus TaxID=1901 RepID=D5SIJ3_STRCL|nr:hypothetical protein [Streptomyces clavuligerus]EFG03736.1 spd1-like putative membrane protein [Streptomyces clavuligerus]MBY6307724.1 hypothetical protein [Streptomyces clavuligerus]QCS09726.1 hypothetical protein CRV15_29335 [Streptomyces clavuligerus]QPJ98228.1 hypothetical protein GE265_35055 [Streptomyces clavuligerus]WDN56436.1 hypothetical protein LL058_31855 [Streptomyces clavuligerus]